MALTQKIKMKKSNASSDQPRKQATNVFRWTAVSRRNLSRSSVCSSPELGFAGCYHICDAGDLRHFGHVVDAHDVRAFEDAGGNGGCGGPDAIRFGSATEGAAEKRFARRAHEKRVAEAGELGEAREQLEILFVGFAEAETGVEDDLGFGDACSEGRSGCFSECGGDVAHRVARKGLLLHAARGAAHVHEDQREFAAARHFGDARVRA